jgi:hypothetical protein
LTGKNTISQTKNTDSKLMDIANCKSCKNILLVVENIMFLRYNCKTTETRYVYESIDEPGEGPFDNLPN